jgi:hypothetical protein
MVEQHPLDATSQQKDATSPCTAWLERKPVGAGLCTRPLKVDI